MLVPETRSLFARFDSIKEPIRIGSFSLQHL
jgi:hypothetical protein